MKNDPALAKAPRRRWRIGRWVLVLLLGWGGYAGWREYDFRLAVEEAKAAGMYWHSTNPFDAVWKDWRAAFRTSTWMRYGRGLSIDGVPDLASVHGLIGRLRPIELVVSDCGNLASLKGIPSIECLAVQRCSTLCDFGDLKDLPALAMIHVSGCEALRSVDGISHHPALKSLLIVDCPLVQSLEDMKGLAALDFFGIAGASALENISVLNGIPSLKVVEIYACAKVPRSAEKELRLAHPSATTSIVIRWNES